MEHLSDDGNLPPYNRLNFENAVLVRVATLTSTNMNGGYAKLSTGYFDAPAGLVILNSVQSIGDIQDLTLTVKEGKYKGVHAPNMLE